MPQDATHTSSEIHLWLHHHPQVKTSVVYCLKSRAERVCTRDDIKEELNHLLRVIQANGYPHAVTAGFSTRIMIDRRCLMGCRGSGST